MKSTRMADFMDRKLWHDIVAVVIAAAVLLTFIFSPILCTNN